MPNGQTPARFPETPVREPQPRAALHDGAAFRRRPHRIEYRSMLRTTHRFVLAHDGGPAGDRALNHLLNGPYRPMATTVDLIHVRQECGSITAMIEQTLAEAVTALKAAGYAANLIIAEGEPTSRLIQICDGSGYDLVVVGRRRPVERQQTTFDGSVSDRLVHRCCVPVTVVH